MKQKKIPAVFIVAAFCTYLLACSKTGSGPAPIPPAPATPPAISMFDISQPRAATTTTMSFYVNSSKATSDVITIDYTLEDGTAKAGTDYVAASGTITIPANQRQAVIYVEIKGEPTNLRQANREFTVKLSNPKFCTLTNTSAKGIILTEDGTFLPTDNTGYSTPATYPGYTLVWSDDFSAPALDPSIWNHEVGNGSGGWGNNELEYYTSSLKNSFQSNGNLIIEARKESIGGFNYSSARLTTQSKKEIKFGRIDIRAKLPVSKGMWPALWMLGANINTVSWPGCGEMDIMELVGSNPSKVLSTMHWKNAASGSHQSKSGEYSLSSGDYSQQFHVFTMIWEQDLIKNYVDDHLISTVSVADVGAASYPFNAPEFFIMNVAVGGNWPGPPDATTIFPQRMFVDYIRVFQ